MSPGQCELSLHPDAQLTCVTAKHPLMQMHYTCFNLPNLTFEIIAPSLSFLPVHLPSRLQRLGIHPGLAVTAWLLIPLLAVRFSGTASRTGAAQ